MGRALYHFDVKQTPTDRERNYVQNLLVGKDTVRIVRAYNLMEYLKARFDSLYARRIDALRKLIRKRTVQGVVGGFLTAVISGGVLGLLIALVSAGRISLASAGAAAAVLIPRWSDPRVGIRSWKSLRKCSVHTGFQRVCGGCPP